MRTDILIDGDFPLLRMGILDDLQLAYQSAIALDMVSSIILS